MSLHVNPASELIREPTLLLPTKKPVGPVKIDWSNPMARQLELGLLFNERSIDTFTIGQGAPLLVKPIPGYTTGPYGLAADFNDEIITVPLNENIFNSGEVPEYTIVSHWKTPARINAYHYSIVFYASAQNARIMRIGYRGFSDTQRRHHVARTQWTTQSQTFDTITSANRVDENTQVVVIYSVRSGKQFLYTHVLEPSGDDIIETDTNSLGSLSHNIDTLALGFQGAIRSYVYSFYLFKNRAMNEQEAVDLARDPYQILIPK